MAKQQRGANNTTVKKAANKPGEITIVDNSIQVGQLQRGNANVARWIKAIKAAEQVMNPQRKDLYDIYLDISIDGHTTSVFEKRDRAVVTAEINWEGMPEGQHLENLRKPWFIKHLKHVMSHRRQGYTVIELKLLNGMFVDSQVVPRQHVLPEYKAITPTMSYAHGPGDLMYAEPPASNYLVEIGDIKDLGLYSVLAPYILMKRDNLADFSLHNELFAMPMRLYFYDPMNPDSRREVEAQAKAQSAAAYVVLPMGASMELKDSNKQGGAAAYKELHNILNDEISIIVLGQTLTTSNDGVGSHALGRVHQAVEQAVNLEDMLFVENYLNGPFRDLATIHGYPAWERAVFKDTELLSASQRINIWNIAKNAGVPISNSAWYNEFDIPAPTPEELEKMGDGGGEGTDPITSLKEKLDAYGVGVRAGSITPQKEDEEWIRTQAGLPAASTNVNKAWEDDGGVRRPITLKGQDAIQAEEEVIKQQAEGSKKKVATETELQAKLSALYSGWSITATRNPKGSTRLETRNQNPDGLQKAWDSIINRIHSGELKPGDVDQALFELVAAELYKGVEEGFGEGVTLSLAKSDAMLADLRNNIYVFSGFKNYHTLKAATEMLLDDTGRIRPFNEFKQLVLEVNSQYNINYLEAEYNTALANSQMASKWLDIEEQKDTLPWLRFRAVLDDRTRHRQYSGITRKVDDPVWNWLTPPLEWQCRCTLEQLADGEPTGPDKIPSTEAVPEIFRFNPGKERVIFSPKHPYFKVDSADEDRAKNLFGLKIPKA